jgi:hypothetical protein
MITTRRSWFHSLLGIAAVPALVKGTLADADYMASKEEEAIALAPKCNYSPGPFTFLHPCEIAIQALILLENQLPRHARFVSLSSISHPLRSRYLSARDFKGYGQTLDFPDMDLTMSMDAFSRRHLIPAVGLISSAMRDDQAFTSYSMELPGGLEVAQNVHGKRAGLRLVRACEIGTNEKITRLDVLARRTL